jgi:predicted PurR-regulated permease PerM
VAIDLPTYDSGHKRRALDVVIHVGLVVLLVAACLVILRPFLPLMAWGIVIAIAVDPGYRKVRSLLHGRGTLAAVICTLVLLAVLIVPVLLLARTLIDGVQSLSAHARDGTIRIPSPPASVSGWPLIGAPLLRVWTMASTNLTDLLRTYSPQIREFVPKLLSASAGIGLAVVQCVLSIAVAGALLANRERCAKATHLLANRLFGDQGNDFHQLAGATIRSVTVGILGVAVIQSVLAGLGFLLMGLPGAGLWTLFFLIAAVLQVGALVLIPAVIYMFAIASTAKAIAFALWCLVVGLLDNVLKPIFLGRGVAVPILVIFLGAIGGFLALGIIGLFVGAIVLSVGYKLSVAWLEPQAAAAQEN